MAIRCREASLAEYLFEAYRAKLAEVNAGKTMTGSPMPAWPEVATKAPDEPGGHVAPCWEAVAVAAREFYEAERVAEARREGRVVDYVVKFHVEVEGLNKVDALTTLIEKVLADKLEKLATSTRGGA